MGFAPQVVHADTHSRLQVCDRNRVRVKWVFCSGRHTDGSGADSEVILGDLTTNAHFLRDGLVAIVDSGETGYV